MKLKNNLKQIRMREFMMNMREFSKHLGIAEQQYSRYESGKSTPSLEIALKISLVLNVSVNEIWSFEEVSIDEMYRQTQE